MARIRATKQADETTSKYGRQRFRYWISSDVLWTRIWRYGYEPFENSSIVITIIRRFCIYMFKDTVSFCIAIFRVFECLRLHFCFYFIYCQDALHQLIALKTWQLHSIWTFKKQKQLLRNNTIYKIYSIITLRIKVILKDYCRCLKMYKL